MAAQLPCITSCFDGPSDVQGVLDALAADGSPFAMDTLSTLQAMSPTSLVLTFELFRRGLVGDLSYAECLALEEHVGVQLLAHSGDFFQGVRSVLVDKGKTKAEWEPPRWAGVQEGVLACVCGVCACVCESGWGTPLLRGAVRSFPP